MSDKLKKNMPNKIQLREDLKRKIDRKIPRVVTAKQLDEAADTLIKSAGVNRELLEKIGADVFGDKQILANTNIDDILDTLNQIKGSSAPHPWPTSQN